VRIAYVTSYRPGSPNGVHAAAASLAAALVGRGVYVEFWHFGRRFERIAEHEEPTGVQVVELPLPGISPSHLTYARWMPAETRRWILKRRTRISLVHFHSIFQPEAWFVSRASDAPYVLSPHGGYVHFLAGGWRRWARQLPWYALERRLVADAAFVHAVSRPDADAVRRLSPGSVVEVIPNGVDLPDAPPVPGTPGSPWLFIGRLAVADKGLDLLIDGYAEASRHAQLPKLVIRGPDYRSGRAWLANRIRAHGLESRIEVGDAVSGAEKIALISQCGLFIHTSRAEGLPVGPLEAMAYSRPVAITSGTNLVEAVARAGAGIVAQDHTVSAVAAALEQAAALDMGDLNDLGVRARRLVEEEFSWSRIAARMSARYVDAIPGARRPS